MKTKCLPRLAWFLIATRNGSPKTGRMIEKPNVSIVRRIAWRTSTNSSNLKINQSQLFDFSIV